MIGALGVYSKFYFVDSVTVDNRYLDFKIGGDFKVAQVRVGSYSITKLLTQVATAMNDVSVGVEFSLEVDRSTRIVTLTGSAPFDWLGLTGTNVGRSIIELLGLPFTDNLGVTQVVGVLPIGTSYNPQFWLQDYLPTSSNSKAANATVSKTASGRPAVQKFGVEKFMRCNIQYITDIVQPPNSIIESNPNGYQLAIDFMEHLRTKSPVEFMVNRNDVENYEILILESTPDVQDGSGYVLRERYDIGLPFYYETGLLKFRLMTGV